MKITFERFDDILKHLVTQHEYEDELCAIARKYNKAYLVDLENPVETDLVHLLADSLDANVDDISYWLYDLEGGKTWHKGAVTDADGKDIPLKTTRDLWNLICPKEEK